jgi:phage gpG-like protein
MGVKRFGDWDRAKALLADSPGVRLTLAIRQATIKNALLLVREIKRGIVKQAPGGVPFVKLAERTIERKGSSKALIDTGFLLSAITQKIMAEEAFVGLLRGTVNKDGEQMVNIGAIMEYGATIKHPSGVTIILPARPFLHPVMEAYREQVIENYRQAIRSVF